MSFINVWYLPVAYVDLPASNARGHTHACTQLTYTLCMMISGKTAMYADPDACRKMLFMNHRSRVSPSQFANPSLILITVLSPAPRIR